MKHAIWCLPALAALIACAPGTQSERRPDPSDASARAPAVTYRSALEDYRRVESEARMDWRGANEEVRRAGGHIGILRDQAAPGARQ